MKTTTNPIILTRPIPSAAKKATKATRSAGGSYFLSLRQLQRARQNNNPQAALEAAYDLLTKTSHPFNF